MSICNIAIAYYNNNNFIKLLDTFEKEFSYTFNATIYNKSNDELILKNNFIIQKHLDNKGREGETYLSHIIENYDNLCEYTIFIQDDTNNHIPNYKAFVTFCNNIITDKEHFVLYPSTWRKGISSVKRTITDGICNLHTLPSNDAIKVACKKLNIHLPKKYTTETCAFFICHKKSILNHEKEFYIELRKWLLSDDKNGFTLEHLWKLIFS